jgi:Domain of unknown function (DUF6817)
MENRFKRLTDFLLQLGTDQVSHTDKTYLAHVIGVYNDVKAAEGDEELAAAGMFHSIYGTEAFQRFALPLDQRPVVRTLIGERAERLAYLNCAMDRPSFDRAVMREGGPYHFVDRFTGKEVDLSDDDFSDLCRVHLYDWLEQVPRSQKWDYRRASYRHMAERLGGSALAAYQRVFAEAPAGASA